MILQRMIYPVIGNCKELYYREYGCKVDACAGVVTFNNDKSYIDFETYFNMFSCGKWNKYTRCGQIGLSVLIKGSVAITINHIVKLDGHTEIKELSKSYYSSPVNKKCVIQIGTIDSGFYSVSISSHEVESEVSDIAYVSMDDTGVPADIVLGLCICTYRRETEVQKNLQIIQDNVINNPLSSLNGKIKVFVSDNASTLEEKNTECLHVFHNRNYGGSGGFTRAIIEAMKSDATHLLLMDDDISFELGVLERTYIFLRLIKAEYRRAFLGAAMLISDRQYIQHAAGEMDDLIGIHFDKRDYDLRKLDYVIANEREMHSNYLGWWYMAMPREAIIDNGYSYPMFVQYDDIEFSIRNSGYEKININGIAVWHDDFEQKKSAVKNYYTIRNRLISHSICFGKFLLVRRWGECVLKSFGRMRRGYYYEAMLILMAGFDYLKGPEYIGGLDMEQKNTELYAYVKRDDTRVSVVEWCKIVGLWIELFAMLLFMRSDVIKRYRDTAEYYTSKEYWVSKLGLSER